MKTVKFHGTEAFLLQSF